MEMTFKLEVFEGPLDLLLHLIDINKIDIYDIPIAMSLPISSQQDLQILLASLRWEPMKRICGWESQAITVLRC